MKIADIDGTIQLRPEKLLRSRFCAPNLFMAGVLLFLCFAASIPVLAQRPCGSYPTPTCNDLAPGLPSGPVMQSPYQVYLLYWIPQGFSLDPGGSVNDGKYSTILTNFFKDLSGSTYLDLVSQYPAPCPRQFNGPNIPTNQSCFGSGSVNITLEASIITPYNPPHAGTHNDPLLDRDIRKVITDFIDANHLVPGLNSEFFVFMGSGVVVCQYNDAQGNHYCTDAPTTTTKQVCNWHNAFLLNDNVYPVVYSLISNGQPNGCQCNITSPNGLASADCAIIGVSHEFFESITDPLWGLASPASPQFGWIDPLNTGNEIGDQCNGMTDPLNTDGSNVTLNGRPYVVQRIWSNDDAGCVLGFAAIIGPSIEYDVGTGTNSLDVFSSATATVESGGNSTLDVLKGLDQPAWGTNSTHVRVFSVPGAKADDVVIALTSGASWDIRDFTLTIRNPNGDTACSIGFFGSPLAALTSQMPTATFTTPICQR